LFDTLLTPDELIYFHDAKIKATIHICKLHKRIILVIRFQLLGVLACAGNMCMRTCICRYRCIYCNVALAHLRMVAGLAELTILNYLMVGNRKAVRE